MEVLAAASSVIAVVSLALQLSDTVQRLVDFWDSVKDTPAEVEEIRSHLRILSALLRSIESDDQRWSTDGGESLGHDCLLVCKGSIAKLEKLSNGWSRELSRRGIQRKWSCLKKALREHELARYWNELERAKTTLMMYQCLRNGQRQSSLDQAIMKMRVPPMETYHQSTISQATESDMSVLVRNRFKKLHLGTKVYELHLSFGIIRLRVSKESVIDESSQRNNMVLVKRPMHWKLVATFLPKVTSWKILECTFKRKYNSIDAGIQTFNIRPGWSPIFKRASWGDVQGVRGLIEDGLASPNDIDTEGWTVLHCAAAAHQARVCQMLLALGAVPDPLTKRRETPLLLATHSNCRNAEFRPINDDSAAINTVRVLVEQGKNDPMQSDDIGWNSIFTASRNRTSDSLLWLMNQDEYHLDLKYETPGGLTTAAVIVQREDLSPSLFQHLVRDGVAIDAPCARGYCFQYGWWFIRYHSMFPWTRQSPWLTHADPSMLQVAVWSWYDKLLNSYENTFPMSYEHNTAYQPVPSPFKTIQTLLANSSNHNSGAAQMHTLLKGLVQNILQFKGKERSLDVTRACISTWLDLVQELGFDLRAYLRIEAEIHRGRRYNMGSGVEMLVSFDEDTAPHIWTMFQGPVEREMGVFVDRISKCANWEKWQARHSLPRRQPPLKEEKFFAQSAEIFLVKKLCSCQSFGPHFNTCLEVRPDDELSQAPSTTLVSPASSRKRRIISNLMYYIISGQRYRHEFTFYVFVLACFFGCSYFARFWIAGIFFLTLKLLQDAVTYWV